ncbi:GntR family transcriptional regulator [Tistrella bauzanensis]|uniref:GntR family transcriptional regulator n=1 Tax=Tistrella bauzanensis TaxID=657419 RepID=A0ABQ1I9Q5_9PROT|nr:FCD domain-containing protein [Tistrella bauzanensis]GGB24948.1 GntR family transcriptional regulator [Tistrella bauzanensis]
MTDADLNPEAVTGHSDLRAAVADGFVGEEGTRAATLSLEALERIRTDIVAGALKPDMKLHLGSMRARYGVGLSPLREALSRLAADGLVSFSGQRGFRVAPVSRADLADITRSRQIVEGAALRLAIACGGDDWEAEIVTSHHLLRRATERSAADHTISVDDVAWAAWEARHRAFHASLVSACPLNALKGFRALLYDKAERYRRLMLSWPFRPDEVLAEHDLLRDAVLARDPDRAVGVLEEHIAITADLLDAELARIEGG